MDLDMIIVPGNCDNSKMVYVEDMKEEEGIEEP